MCTSGRIEVPELSYHDEIGMSYIGYIEEKMAMLLEPLKDDWGATDVATR